jgi:hypothetical protein
MDINELNQWLETEEGEKWGDEFKAPLLSKRDELLAALKEANGKLAESEQRSSAAAEELSQERAALSTLVVDKELSRLLREAHVMEPIISSLVAELKERNAITVKADGPNRQAVGKTKGEDGTEKEASLEEIVSLWRETLAAKAVTLNNATGGGSTGSTGGVVNTPTLQALRGPDLAKMSDDQFHIMRQNAMSARGE